MENAVFSLRKTAARTSALCLASSLAPALAAAGDLTPSDPLLRELLDAYERAKRSAAVEAQPPIVAPRPAAIFAPALLAYAEQAPNSTDAVIALDWLSENAPRTADDALAAARWVESALARLQTMDRSDATVRQSTAFAAFQLGCLLYLDSPAPYMRSHDADFSPVRDEERVARASRAFALAALAEPDGRYGVWARQFEREIQSQRVGRMAPDRIGGAPDGSDVRLSALRGKVVVVKFYDFYYGTAGDQFASERELRRAVNDKRLVVLLAQHGEPEKTRVVELQDPSGVIEYSDPGQVASDWSARGLPQTYVIDAAGVIFAAFAGTPSAHELQQAVRGALAAAP